MEEIKRIDLNEFVEKGYLQEANRRYFHPLGLALEVVVNRIDADENHDTLTLGGIWDYREDEEGLYFDIKNADEKHKELYKKKAQFIVDEIGKREKARISLLGDIIEPVE